MENPCNTESTEVYEFGTDHFETFIEYLEGLVTISGAVIAITLTAFIFLITDKRENLRVDELIGKKAETSPILGPFCLIYSFLFGLMSFMVFSIMNRHEVGYFESSVGSFEFFSWLTPTHQWIIALYFGILFLTYGLFYITKNWLSNLHFVNEEEEQKKVHSILQVVYVFVMVTPPLFLVFMNMATNQIWDIFELDENWGIANIAIAILSAAVLIKPVRNLFKKFNSKQIRLMYVVLVVVLVLTVFQFGLNIMYMTKCIPSGLKEFEYSLMILRTLFATSITLVSFGFITKDYSAFLESVKGKNEG